MWARMGRGPRRKWLWTQLVLMSDVAFLQRRMAVERTNKDGKGTKGKEVKDIKGWGKGKERVRGGCVEGMTSPR